MREWGATVAGHWRVIAEREVFSAPPRLRLSIETIELPDGRRVDDFYQLQLQAFVNVFAETPEGRVLVLRQYKHGARRIGLTFPGGHLEAGESAQVAAERELLEETGYRAVTWRSLGSTVTNGNQGGATAHLLLASGCVRVREPASGDLEDMEVLSLTRAELFAAAARGAFSVFDHLGLLAVATNPDLLAALDELVLTSNGV